MTTARDSKLFQQGIWWQRDSCVLECVASDLVWHLEYDGVADPPMKFVDSTKLSALRGNPYALRP